MEIKGIGGIIPAYKNSKVGAAKKTNAAVTHKNTDRVEFGFSALIDAEKAAIAQEVRTDAAPRELLDAGETAQNGIDSGILASIIFMG